MHLYFLSDLPRQNSLLLFPRTLHTQTHHSLASSNRNRESRNESICPGHKMKRGQCRIMSGQQLLSGHKVTLWCSCPLSQDIYNLILVRHRTVETLRNVFRDYIYPFRQLRGMWLDWPRWQKYQRVQRGQVAVKCSVRSTRDFVRKINCMDSLQSKSRIP